MNTVKLYSYQESRPGNQELVWAIWRNYFQTPTLQSEGLIESSFENESGKASSSQLCFEFTEQRYLTAFEFSVIFNSYIWEVLPLLTHMPVISHTSNINLPQEMIKSNSSDLSGANSIVHGAAQFLHDIFPARHRPNK
jgi:hypothetical protein